MSNISLKQLIERNRVLQGMKRVASNTTNNIVNGFANFKQNASESLSELKKNNASRLVALMLAGATIASMSACDTIGAEKFEHGELYNNAMQEEVVSGVTFDDITPDNYYNYINEIEEQYPYGVAPYKFLNDKGILDLDENGNPVYEGCKSFRTCIMIDEDSGNNIYVLLNYKYYSDTENEEDIVYTWKLKYNLEEQDYKDIVFLSLKQDFKVLSFMEYLEDKYQYNIESQTISGKTLETRSSNWIKIGNGFSSTSIHNLDTVTGDVEFYNFKLHENYMREAIYYTNIKNGQFWNYAIDEGFTEDYILENCFPIINTEFGIGHTYNNIELDILGMNVAIHGTHFNGEVSEEVKSVPYEITHEYKVVLTSGDIIQLTPKAYDNYDKTMEEFNKSYKENKEFIEQKYYNSTQLSK